MLTNKIVLITGAGSGLGRALSIVFCNQGAKVVGIGRKRNTLCETQQAVKAKCVEYPDNFSFFECDVSAFEKVDSVVSKVIEDYGRIDYVFNNAAIYNKVNFLEESSEEFAAAINVNILGLANVCKAVLPEMINKKYGRIYNVGSFADINPIPNSAAYSASKGALHGLTKGIAIDIAHHDLDVEVHEWVPGHMKTGMSDFTGLEPEVAAQWALAITNIVPKKKSAVFNENAEFDTERKPLLKRGIHKLFGRN